MRDALRMTQGAPVETVGKFIFSNLTEAESLSFAIRWTMSRATKLRKARGLEPLWHKTMSNDLYYPPGHPQRAYLGKARLARFNDSIDPIVEAPRKRFGFVAVVSFIVRIAIWAAIGWGTLYGWYLIWTLIRQGHW